MLFPYFPEKFVSRKKIADVAILSELKITR